MQSRNFLTSSLVLATCVGGASLLAAGPLGAPTAGLAKKQVAVGVEYAYAELATEVNDGYDNFGTPVGSFLVDPFKWQTVYATLGYGILNIWEFGAKVGATWGEWNIAGSRFSGDVGPYLGCYTRVTAYRSGGFSIGGVAQFDWNQTSGPNTGPGWAGETEVEFIRVRVGIGPQYDICDRFSVYAGPFWQYVDGDKRYKEPGYWEHFDVETHDQWGGFFGFDARLFDQTHLGADCQLTGDDWVFGISVRQGL